MDLIRFHWGWKKAILQTTDRKKKVNTSFSSWPGLLLGVSQWSVFGPLPFHIFLNSFFHLTECTNVSSYADDTNFYACDSDWKNLIARFDYVSLLAIEWF